MKALSICQPWATLIIIGAKRIETRSWPTNYRGRIAIHASKTKPIHFKELCGQEPFKLALYSKGILDAEQLPRGCIIGSVKLEECVRAEEVPYIGEEERAFGDYRPGRWCWILRDPQPVACPISCRGKLGLFDTNLLEERP